jgi:hypothetical protein
VPCETLYQIQGSPKFSKACVAPPRATFLSCERFHCSSEALPRDQEQSLGLRKEGEVVADEKSAEITAGEPTPMPNCA